MKKKFTMLFAALLAFVGVANAQTVITDVASLTDDMECTVATSERGGWAVNADKNRFGSTNDYGFGKTVDLTNDQHIFQFKKIGDKVYLYSLYAEKFVNKDRTLSETEAQAIEFIAMDGSNEGKFVVKFGDDAYINLGGDNQMVINSWGATAGQYDAGNMVTITDVTELRKASAEYIALTELIGTAEALAETVNKYIGNAIGEYTEATATALATAISTAKALDKNEVKQSHVDALQTAINAVKNNLPTVGQYYQIHSSLTAFAETKALYSNGTVPGWKTLNDNDKSFYWLAVAAEGGNVVLQNAADGKYLVGNADRSGAWTMADALASASNISVKIFGKNEKVYEYGVIMNNWQMHCNNHGNGGNSEGNIVSWNTDAANSASSWYIVEVELKEFCDITYNFVYNEEVKYSSKTSVAKGAAYPEVVVPALPYGVVANATTPEGTVTEATAVEFELTVEHELPFVAAADVNNINTWYYAQMHANANVTAYVEDNQNKDNNVEWADKAVAADEIDSHLWGFAGDVWSGIKMVNKGTGRAIVSTSGAAVMGDKANATAFIPVYSNGAYRDGWFCLKYPTNGDHLNAQDGKIASWWDDDNGSSFKLTSYQEKTVTISEVDYSTLYLDYATYIPEGVEVYAVSSIENGYVALEAVEGVLPANTGVIIKNAGEYTFIAAGATGDATSLLQGSTTDTYVAGNAYVLAAKEGVVGLYKAILNKDENGAEGTTHFKNNAFKAYLPVAEGEDAPAMFTLGRGGEEDEDATGIDQLINNGEVVIYDLAGRRVEKMEKGIYIVNGKKVIR